MTVKPPGSALFCKNIAINSVAMFFNWNTSLNHPLTHLRCPLPVNLILKSKKKARNAAYEKFTIHFDLFLRHNRPGFKPGPNL